MRKLLLSALTAAIVLPISPLVLLIIAALGLAGCAVPNCSPGHLTCGVN